MTRSDADRNLLFGILAIQMDFITRDALIAAMSAWVMEKHRPLGDILVERGALDPIDRAALDPMIARHLARHGGDPARSLAALSSIDTAASALRRSIADPDVLESLAHVPPSRLEDPYATKAGAPFEPPPSGIRYHKVRDHAKGGLGVVFVARDQELNREVALKEIQDRHADDPTSRARFLIEAEVTGGLEHPGIVPVYGLGSYDDGRPFYAMRFIKGDSLKEAIAAFHADNALKVDPGRRILALQKLIRRFLDVCNAIAYAHSRGVLHRDLKPDNVMVGRFGETLVVDWGLAKATGRSGDNDEVTLPEAVLHPASSSGSAETMPGSVVGTPAYMSPEQAAGRLDLLGPASDVYSLGATLYTLLTGRVPFDTKDLGEVFRKVERGEFPRPREASPWLDPALEAVCLKAMALRPGDRYSSPVKLASDIEHWMADEPVSAWSEPFWVRAGRWTKRHRTLVASAISAAIVALVGGVYISLEAQVRAEKQHFQEERQREEARQREVRQRSMDYQVLLGKARDRLANRGRDWTGPVLESLGQAVRIEAENRDWAVLRSLATSCFASEDVRPIGTLSFITEGPFARGPSEVFCIAFDRDGKRLAAGQYHSALNLDVQVFEVSERRRIATYRIPYVGMISKSGVRSLAFSADGRWLAAGTRQRNLYLWDLGRQDSKPIERATPGSVGGLAFTDDGRTLISASEDRTVQVWDAATGWAETAKVEFEVGVSRPDLSPDGLLLALERADGVGLLDVAGLLSRPARVSVRSAIGKYTRPRFSPDGRTLATALKDVISLQDVRPEGLVEVRRLFDPEQLRSVGGELTSLDFHRDGAMLLSTGSDKVVRLWDLVSNKILAQLPVSEGNQFPKFSPDGRLIAVIDGKSIALWERADSVLVAVAPHHSYPVRALAFGPWAADGRVALACLAGENDKSNGETLRQSLSIWHPETLRSLGEKRSPEVKWPAGDIVEVSLRALAIHPHRPSLAFCRPEGIMLWEPGAEPHPLGTSDTPGVLDFDRSGERLWGLVNEDRVTSWPLVGSKVYLPWTNTVDRLVKTRAGLTSLNAGGKWVVVGSINSSVYLLRQADGQAEKTLFQTPPDSRSNPNPPTCLALSSAENLLAIGTPNGTIHVIGIPSGERAAELTDHSDVVQAVAFSPDDALLASVGRDRSLILWRQRNGSFEKLLSLRSPSGRPIMGLSWSPDGQTLAMVVQNDFGAWLLRSDRLRARLATMGLDWN